MSASIYDVAQRAGVSIATVSRFLNGSATVSEKKAQAVQEAMEFYQYEPNQFARGLMKQESKMIGIYFPEGQGSMFDSIYNLELLKGIEQALSYQNYSMVLLKGRPGLFSKRRQQIPRYLEFIRQKRVDGLILSGVGDGPAGWEAFQQIVEEAFPMVYIGKRFHKKGFNVYAQFEQYHVNMVDKLRQSGHRSILMLLQSSHIHYLTEIAAQVKDRMPEVTLYPVILDAGQEFQESLTRTIKEHVLGAGCTAVIPEGSENTQVLLSVCAELGISVPNRLSILAVEHRRGAAHRLYPKISSCYVPARAMGGSAAELLIRYIRGEEIEEKSIEYESIFVPGDSIRRL